MRTPFSESIMGSSALFDTYTFSKLTESQTYIRHAINTEMGRNIEVDQVEMYPQPRDKKGTILKPTKISSKAYSTLISRFPGAFVKPPMASIFNDGSLIIDLDASSLYPSMILQSNISFDSYKGRIIPVCTYKTIELLESVIGKSAYPAALPSSINNMVVNYVEKKAKDKKQDVIRSMYYSIMHLFDILGRSGIPMAQIYQPQTTASTVLLKTVLVPLLDLINTIHPDNPEFSQFSFDYLFMHENELPKKYNKLYILHDAGESTLNIKSYNLQDGIAEIQKSIVTLAGTLFYKHSERIGLFASFLQQMGAMRKQYKSMRGADDNTETYRLNDQRQNAVKVIMNTTSLEVHMLVTTYCKLREFRESLREKSYGNRVTRIYSYHPEPSF